ncbi:MAG: hypothetical protein ACKOE6_10630 [Flammeovirgaceae bacterium]
MKLNLTALFFAFAVSCWGQNAALDQLYASSPTAPSRQIAQAKLADFVAAQSRKRESAKSEAQFMNRLVKSVHAEFLRSYKPYVQINEPFETGNYDCLTGTAIFSIVLTELGIPHQIIETNYHIFLTIDGKEQKYLLETTDKLLGLKTQASEINASLALYKQNKLAPVATGAHYYLFKENLFRAVAPSQLKGLLHFNQAVVAFNSQRLAICVEQLELARLNYDNPRVHELAELVSDAIALSMLSEKEKYVLLMKLTGFQEPVLALR